MRSCLRREGLAECHSGAWGHHETIQERKGSTEGENTQTFSCFVIISWVGPDYGFSGKNKIDPEAEAGRARYSVATRTPPATGQSACQLDLQPSANCYFLCTEPTLMHHFRDGRTNFSTWSWVKGKVIIDVLLAVTREHSSGNPFLRQG